MSSGSGQLNPAAWKRLIVVRTVDGATPIRRAISRVGHRPESNVRGWLCQLEWRAAAICLYPIQRFVQKQAGSRGLLI
jgi:hypothetical protein